MQSNSQPAIGNPESVLVLHGNRLFRICLMLLGNEHDAKDAMQETMLKYLQKTSGFENFEHEKSWLVMVATNQCRDMLRFRLKHPQVELEYIKSLTTIPEGSEIMEAVMGLPEKYRVVIVLHYIEEYKVEEIAKMLGKSVSAVKMRLHRARALLEETYRKEFM